LSGVPQHREDFVRQYLQAVPAHGRNHRDPAALIQPLRALAAHGLSFNHRKLAMPVCRSVCRPDELSTTFTGNLEACVDHAYRHTPGTILCVDDELGALQMRRAVLETHGYQVFTATTAEKALYLFSTQTIDLVLTDHLMPNACGTALAGDLKRVKPHIPVVVLSGLPDPPRDLGAADMFINKLIPPDELFAKLDALLARPRG
jgi:CheY-like chemotaxis protein